MTVADNCVLMCTTVWLQHPSAASSLLHLCLYMLNWWFLYYTPCTALLCFQFSCLFSPPPLSYSLDTPFYSFFPFSCLSCFSYLSYTALCALCTYILYVRFQQKACLLRGVDSHLSLTSSLNPSLFHDLSLFLSCSHHTASFSGLLDADWEQQTRDRGPERGKGGGAGEEGGGGGEGRCGLPWLPTATPLSVTASSPSLSPSPSPSPYPSPLGWRGRKQREGEVAAVDAAAAISGVRGASYIPPPSLPLLYSICNRAPKEEAAGQGGLPRREAPVPGCSPSPGPLPSSGSPKSPMEPLPTQGQILRHYTASRPRPRRTHTQPPSSRPQVRTQAHAQTHTHAHTSTNTQTLAIHTQTHSYLILLKLHSICISTFHTICASKIYLYRQRLSKNTATVKYEI